MFTPVLDSILFFMVSLPIVGWLAQKIGLNRIRDVYAILGFMLSGYALIGLYEEVSKSRIILIKIATFGPPLGACLVIDTLSIFMAFTFLLLSIFVSVYSVRYMEHETRVTEYYALFLGMVAGMIGVVFAGDFFTFFIFWELMCVTSYVLVAFRKELWAPIEAAFKYLIMSTFGSVTIFFAMSFLYGMVGTLNFAHLATSIRTVTPNYWLYLTIAMIVVGFGIKAAIVPFHTWLPDAHPEAPSSVSALLSGILIACGIYGLSRILILIFNPAQFQWGILVAILSVITMTIGNFMALLQSDVKRLLAYSSIAHIGYILVGVAVATETGLGGAFLHVFNHSLMKGLAFLCAGAFIHQAGTRKLNELAGIGRRMPISAFVFCVALLALLGVPSLNGFISKLILVKAAIEANASILAIVLVINSVFSAAYYLRIMQIIMLASPARKIAKVKEAPLAMVIPMCMMALLIVFFGVYPEPVTVFAEKTASAILNVQEFIKLVY